jgi:putative ATP-binding cassette transporter
LIVGLIPYVAKCDEAAQAVGRLEEALDAGHTVIANEKRVLPVPTSPKTIRFNEVVFKYRSETNESFTLGPLSFSVGLPDLLFITGGNGSGKSTLLKVLTGLYSPDSGYIEVDGVVVGPDNIQGYRELFSAIFADFHLFEKLYGMFGTSGQAVTELLKEMSLDRKVQFTDDRFTTLDLSTGQKKRLALVVSLLERKVIYVFDELAADQDPEFRRFLYEDLLPQLKKQGHGVIAATHDDRYFHVADRIMKMEYGKIEYIRPKA